MAQSAGVASGPARRGDAPPPGFPWRVAAVVVGVGCLSAYLWLWLAEGKPLGGAVLLVPALLALSAPALLLARRTERGFDLAGLMATGLTLRFVAAYFRWTNGADSHKYHEVGTQLADSFRSLHFDIDTGGKVPGTGGLNYLSGLVSVPTGSDEFAKFMIFTWFGFWGCVLMYRALVTALPDADRRRYALLIFLWPSMIFWPSSIGKESWMLFTLGAAMLGAARVLTRQRGGYSLLVLGLLGASLVRPHVALLALLAFGVGLLLSRREITPGGALTPASVAKVAGLVVLLVVGSVLVGRTQELLDKGVTGDPVTLSSALENAQERTSQGGSSFTARSAGTPNGYAVALVTVLFRPFPQEASGFEGILTAAEGLFLAGLMVRSWRRLLTIPRRLRAEPYYTVALAYLLMFTYAFASINNFGILARQRVQVLPFIFVLLAVPAVAKAARPRRAAPPPLRA